MARDRRLAVRRAAHDLLDEKLEAWAANQSLDDAVEKLLAAEVPASRVVNGHRLMPHPQLEHREFFQNMVHPVTGDTRYPGFPMNYSILGKRLHTMPPPTLGQNNDDVLKGELGLSDEEMEQLREKKVIGTRPSIM